MPSSGASAATRSTNAPGWVGGSTTCAWASPSRWGTRPGPARRCRYARRSATPSGSRSSGRRSVGQDRPYHRTILRRALEQALRDGLITRNAAALVQAPRTESGRCGPWTLRAAHLFLGEARRSSRYYRLYLAALTTGMRQGDLLGLRWSDCRPGPRPRGGAANLLPPRRPAALQGAQNGGLAAYGPAAARAGRPSCGS